MEASGNRSGSLRAIVMGVIVSGQGWRWSGMAVPRVKVREWSGMVVPRVTVSGQGWRYPDFGRNMLDNRGVFSRLCGGEVICYRAVVPRIINWTELRTICEMGLWQGGRVLIILTEMGSPTHSGQHLSPAGIQSVNGERELGKLSLFSAF